MHRAYVERAADVVSRQREDKPEEVASAHGELVTGGSPSEEILHYVEKNDIDLILMATHGRSGISRWAMGSVAYKVLRSSRVPVWLVRAGTSEKIIEDRLATRTILVPLDGSKLAELVLPHIEALAKQWADGQLEIVLLRVCEPPVVHADYPSNMPLSWEEHVEMETTKCKLVSRPYLAEVEKRLKDAGLKVHSEVPLGNTAEAIVDCAQKSQASLIAMITHGRSGISRWVYGSVAEKVMLDTSTPVLLVGAK
jgi:nucleotide-binding universal stress UspA family protein